MSGFLVLTVGRRQRLHSIDLAPPAIALPLFLASTTSDDDDHDHDDETAAAAAAAAASASSSSLQSSAASLEEKSEGEVLGDEIRRGESDECLELALECACELEARHCAVSE